MVKYNGSEAAEQGLSIGKHRVKVEDVELIVSDFGVQQVKVQVVCTGSADDQTEIDRKRTEWLDTHGKAAGKFRNFAVAVGLATEQELEGGADIDENLSIGKECLVEVGEYKGKPSIGFAWFAFDAKKAESFPAAIRQPSTGGGQSDQSAQSAQSTNGGNGQAEPAVEAGDFF